MPLLGALSADMALPLTHMSSGLNMMSGWMVARAELSQITLESVTLRSSLSWAVGSERGRLGSDTLGVSRDYHTTHVELTDAH